MPIKEIERKIIKKMFSFAKELCNSDIPQFYELGHYMTDNLISKIGIIIATENGLNFSRRIKGGKVITNSFYDLYNKILKFKFPSIPDFKRIESLHDKRNIYQHGETSITTHFNKEYAQQYIVLAEEVLNKVQFTDKNVKLTPSNYLAPVSNKELEAQKLNHENDTKIQSINALHDICSYIYNSSLRSHSKFSGVVIAALDLIKTHRILLQPLGISYIERDLTKTSNYFFFEIKKEVIRILINVNCDQNLEIILDIRNFTIDKIIKFTLDDNFINDFKRISDILQCLHSKLNNFAF